MREAAQWTLAFVLVAAGIAYSLISLFKGETFTSPPAWLAVSIGTAIGYYFGHQTQQATMSGISNGVTAMLSQMATQTRAGSRNTDVAVRIPPAPSGEAG